MIKFLLIFHVLSVAFNIPSRFSSGLSSSPIREELGADTLFLREVRPLGFGDAGLGIEFVISFKKEKRIGK